jgi:hypothetical protein
MVAIAHPTHLSTMSRTPTPPTALTPAVQRRPVAGARRAIPRRIHGVRLAITSTARSERRIAVRRPGVDIDASSASADPTQPQLPARRGFGKTSTQGVGFVPFQQRLGSGPPTVKSKVDLAPAILASACLIAASMRSLRSRHCRSPTPPLRENPTWRTSMANWRRSSQSCFTAPSSQPSQTIP